VGKPEKQKGRTPQGPKVARRDKGGFACSEPMDERFERDKGRTEDVVAIGPLGPRSPARAFALQPRENDFADGASANDRAELHRRTFTAPTGRIVDAAAVRFESTAASRT
jgi:hypothetical protein